MSESSARLVLEIELGREPISGSLIDSGGVLRAYHGWMELASLLESERAKTGATALGGAACLHGDG
jgi:hypothetical protein